MRTNSKRGNKYLNAVPDRSSKKKTKSTVRAEKKWHRDGLIWRTLAKHEGMTLQQLATAMPETLRLALHAGIPGTEKRDGKWHAFGVTEEWLEVLL